MRRLLGVLFGALGLGALLRRRRATLAPSPAADLREKLTASRVAPPPPPMPPMPAPDTQPPPDPVPDEPPAADEAPPVEDEPEPDPEPDPDADRRSEVHDRARRAIDELREPGP